MKIAYFGYDPLFSCIAEFVKKDFEFAAIYTGENSPFTDKMINFAQDHNIPCHFTKPSVAQMQLLVEQGVELFFCAEYPWKIPIPEGLPYAINLHPTLLPQGRGKTPLPQLILQHSKHAGITFHKLSNTIDTGDILLQKAISLDDNETFDSLSAKIYQQAPSLLAKLLADLHAYYQHSQVQGEGSYWPSITQQQQSIDWRLPTTKLLTTIRAFGSLGTYVEIAGQSCIVTAAEGKTYQHAYAAGQVLSNNHNFLIIATLDGELCIPKNALIIR